MKQVVGSEYISDGYLFALLWAVCAVAGVALFLWLRMRSA